METIVKVPSHSLHEPGELRDVVARLAQQLTEPDCLVATPLKIPCVDYSSVVFVRVPPLEHHATEGLVALKALAKQFDAEELSEVGDALLEIVEGTPF